MSFQWARNRIKNEHQYFHQCECEHVNPIMFISPLDFIGVCVYESQGWSHCILFQDFCWKYKFSRCILKSMKIDILKLIFFLKLNGILARWGILLKLMILILSPLSTIYFARMKRRLGSHVGYHLQYIPKTWIFKLNRRAYWRLMWSLTIGYIGGQHLLTLGIYPTISELSNLTRLSLLLLKGCREGRLNNIMMTLVIFLKQKYKIIFDMHRLGEPGVNNWYITITQNALEDKFENQFSLSNREPRWIDKLMPKFTQLFQKEIGS